MLLTRRFHTSRAIPRGERSGSLTPTATESVYCAHERIADGVSGIGIGDSRLCRIVLTSWRRNFRQTWRRQTDSNQAEDISPLGSSSPSGPANPKSTSAGKIEGENTVNPFIQRKATIGDDAPENSTVCRLNTAAPSKRPSSASRLRRAAVTCALLLAYGPSARTTLYCNRSYYELTPRSGTPFNCVGFLNNGC